MAYTNENKVLDGENLNAPAVVEITDTGGEQPGHENAPEAPKVAAPSPLLTTHV